MHFDLLRPCANCPFRSDITFPLSVRRTQEILDAITRHDQTFACHKTLDREGWDDAEITYMHTGNEQHCAGALIMLEKIERPNQMMRIAERLGMYDRRRMEMTAPVFHSPQAMLARMRSLARRDHVRRQQTKGAIGFQLEPNRVPPEIGMSNTSIVPIDGEE